METTPYVEAIRADLEASVAGDQEAHTVAERLARSLEASIQLRIFDALGQAAVELSEQMDAAHAEVRLAGRDVQLVYVPDAHADVPPRATDEDGGTARLTLRMPEALKSRVERAADRDHVSTNAWLVRAISRALDAAPSRRRGGNRLTGFAQS
jgi:hypothetical protein